MTGSSRIFKGIIRNYSIHQTHIPDISPGVVPDNRYGGCGLEKSPSDQIKNRWVTSIHLDKIAAIKQIWPRLVDGERGISLEVPLIMTDQNVDLFSLGRQHLVEKLLAEMLAGFIDTGVDPVTGELH